ncbi:bifunctional salicylyl-CoA 5-hydroxylase/oxidoreductase [Enemella sp. A6]|uniref:bifunctional salicylyl-CoA 5-hydroxylase/oxidoreductase n=1 Tax=Enemella sp. A6 TaxID=3440152 RepID=UPI003EC127C9
MKIAVIGGGPGGLYFAALMKQLSADHEVTVWERNAPDDTFGFGVVFSDETLGGIGNADKAVARAMANRFARWTDIDIHYDDTVVTVGGQGFAAMSRKELLELLQQRVAELDVEVHYSTMAPDVDELSRDYDLVLAADGLRSIVRDRYADTFGPSLDRRDCKYMWLGTDQVFEAFKFFVVKTEWGIMQIHGYPYSDKGSTFIVEMSEEVWRRAGFDRTENEEFPPGTSDEYAIERVREIFADALGGHQVLANNSKWLNFHTVRNQKWVHNNVVLLGDAAHTAHFSIGSGTKLAMEDSLALAACIHEHDSLDEALAAYEKERRPVVESTQRAAQASMEWFENINQYADQDADEFAFNLLTRSRRITLDNLRVRDPEFAAQTVAAFADRVGSARRDVPAMFQPVQLGEVELTNRVVVPPMALYSATDGVPGELHLVNLGSLAQGGAGLVFTEMLAVSPQGRVTPGCAGLWNDEQVSAWRGIVDYVHTNTSAKIGCQLGHSGRRGSMQVDWQMITEPLTDGAWDLLGPSAIPFGEGLPVPKAMTREDMEWVKAEFVAAAERAVEVGFDVLELNAAHGYLLSSFLSPVSNQRNDEYGGSLENRLRYPLEVFDAVRAEWPADKPLVVRISAIDWIPGGNTLDDGVEIARAFIERGADAIHVSSGEVAEEQQPEYGRSFQTPFADRIRNEVAAKVGVPVIAVGGISSYDDVNSILVAGRADLCALGRVHLYDPHWTLHAAAEQDYRGPGAEWIDPYRIGSRKPPSSRTDAVRPRLALIQEPDTGELPTHMRWVNGRTVDAETGEEVRPPAHG